MHNRFLLVIIILIAGFAAGSANAQTARVARSALETPRDALRISIQNSRAELQSALDKLNGELVRIAVAADRQRIIDFVNRAKPQIESAISRLDGMQARLNDPTADPVAIRAEFDGTTRVLLQNIHTFERSIRERIMTVTQVTRAIRSSDQAIMRASRLAKKSSEGDGVFGGLRHAFELQEEARQALADGRLELAMRLTLKARDLVGESISAALDSADMLIVKERAVDYYNETMRLIEKIRPTINGPGNPRVANRLEQAEKLVLKAHDIVREKPYLAMRYLREGREIVNTLARFEDRKENINDRLDRFSQKLEETKTAIAESGNLRARQVMEKAAAHFQNAKDLHQNNQDNGATAQLDIATKLAARAADLARGDGVTDRSLRKEIIKTGMIVRRAEKVALTNDQKESVHKAQSQLDEARLKEDNPSVCLNLLDAATDIAFKVIAQVHVSESKDR